MKRESFDPSTLEITNLRTAVVASNFDYPLLRIDTNQGVYGLGEVRDAGHRESALMYKGLLLGRNPTDVDRLLRRMRPFAGHGREGGGISGVEMALWDITGKVYGVSVYQFLGGKYSEVRRDQCASQSERQPVDTTTEDGSLSLRRRSFETRWQTPFRPSF